MQINRVDFFHRSAFARAVYAPAPDAQLWLLGAAELTHVCKTLTHPYEVKNAQNIADYISHFLPHVLRPHLF